MNASRFLWPRSLAGQLVLALLAVLILAQLIAFFIATDERRTAVERTMRDQVVVRTVDLARVVAEAAPEQQIRFARLSSDRRFRFEVTDANMLARADDDDRDGSLERRIADELGPLARDVRVVYGEEGLARWFRPRRDMPHMAPRDDVRRPPFLRDFVGLAISINLPSGRWLNLRTLVRTEPPSYGGIAMASIVATAIALVVVVIFLVRRMTRPLRALAGAAEALGRGESVAPLAEAGPSDVRGTIAAFNSMQDRLKRFVDDRTRMLAAISHDLRTPITVLKLRAEMVDDAETREAMKATLAEMQQMVEATLAFARDDAAQEETRVVDLGALVDSLVDDLAVMGGDVTFEEGPKVTLACRPNALKRALRNLIDNAVAYGARARVRVGQTGKIAVIEIDDDGPGIAEADRARVFEPFVRLDASRNKETGGIGLGLSIARTIVRAHGGDIALSTRPEGGLRASVTLPL
jgi:signal transduction histidine kinase